MNSKSIFSDKTTCYERYRCYDKWLDVCGITSIPDEVKDFLGAKEGIEFAKSWCNQEQPRLDMLKGTFDELPEKSKEKRLKKIKESEEKLKTHKEELQFQISRYKEVEAKAKEQLFEIAKKIAMSENGGDYFDKMVELRSKRLQGDSIQSENKDIFRNLEANLAEKLMWASQILWEIDDIPF